MIVTVGSGQVPRIIRFSGSPTSVAPGGAVSLCWQVENATSISLAPGGMSGLKASDCTSVTPSQTTNYTLTAGNSAGQVTAVAVATVVASVRILTFTSSPAASTAPGAKVTLNWTTENATSVVLTGNGAPSGTMPVNGSAVVAPTNDTTYTLIAYGASSQVSAVLLIRVGSGTGTGGPIADAGPNQSTYGPLVYLNGSKSKDPNGGPLTFSWRVAGVKPASITNGSTAVPQVQLMGGFGDYVFELTVTDQNGQRATATTTVTLIDP